MCSVQEREREREEEGGGGREEGESGRERERERERGLLQIFFFPVEEAMGVSQHHDAVS